MRELFVAFLALVAIAEGARFSVSRGGKNVTATKMENLCARMHNNTALEGVDPIEMLKDTAYECQRKCVDMWPGCSAVVYYYLHNETKHHYCYLFELNSVHEKVTLVEQKPESKKDLVRMLELVADCHQFDAHPPLDEDGIASSTDKVDRKKRQNNDENDVKKAGDWTDWTECSTGLNHAVRSQACEYGRKIQRRGCPARMIPQRNDPRFQQPFAPQQPAIDPRQDPRYLQHQQAQTAQVQQQRPDPRQDPRQDPRYQQQEQQRQLQLQQQQRQPQAPPQAQPQAQQPQAPPQAQPQPPQDPRQDPRYLQQLAEHQRRLQQHQQQAQQRAGAPLTVQQNAPQQFAQQYQQRVSDMRHPAQPQAQPCSGGVCRTRPAPPPPPPPAPVTQAPFQYPQPTRYRPAPPPPPACRGDGCAQPQTQGQWHDWSEWSQCSCTCGDGMKQRRRECNGNNCQGQDFEQQPCNMGPCQTWSEWCEWSECKGTCGRGERTRTRFCFLGTKRCEGSDFEIEVCNAGPCPEWSEWEDWSTCSTTCGHGAQNRQRTCLGGVHGDHMCPGPRTEERSCDHGPCSIWANWEEWGSCSASCGDGMKRRQRVCQYGTDCQGPAEETLFCYGPPCSAWTEWCEWSACSTRCGAGQRSRTRACLTSTGQETNECAGPSHETVLCNEGECCSWAEWCPWSQCDRDCGTGQAFRSRVCQRNGVTDPSCECVGPDRETRECNNHACQPQCAWTEWCAWSDCSTQSACELGNQQRSRQCVGEPGCHCLGLAEEKQQCRGQIPCSPKPPC
ncbi:unnamed protein product, partial [Mesorhabditis belari]|uniref:Apple domain-containing protein n=1 Tax=Mesorhabditis belari TaxID=2138241 RepID=A0AAF3EGX6_9BILA